MGAARRAGVLGRSRGGGHRVPGRCLAAPVDRRRRADRPAHRPQPHRRQRPRLQRRGEGRVQHLHGVDLSHLRHPRGGRLPARVGRPRAGARPEHDRGGVRDARYPRDVPRDAAGARRRPDAAAAVRRGGLHHAPARPGLRDLRPGDGPGDLLDRRDVAGAATVGARAAPRTPVRPAGGGDRGDRVRRRPGTARAAGDGAGLGGLPRAAGGRPAVVAAPGLAGGDRGHGPRGLPGVAHVVLRAAVPADGRRQGRGRLQMGQGRRLPVGPARAVRAAPPAGGDPRGRAGVVVGDRPPAPPPPPTPPPPPPIPPPRPAIRYSAG